MTEQTSGAHGRVDSEQGTDDHGYFQNSGYRSEQGLTLTQEGSSSYYTGDPHSGTKPYDKVRAFALKLVGSTSAHFVRSIQLTWRRLSR